MKLLIGGEEVSEDYIEKSIIEYNKKINSPAYKKELEHFAEFMKRSITENTNPCEYYKLTFPPHTIFKLDRKNASSYKYDDFRKVWVEFPAFIVDFEHGNISAERISFDDNFPVCTK